ncbi:radical SAM protein [archaeon]|nr:radical SAM protein [archaeon]MBL7057427.1 radical SAM protein [Candidatus Woesearchaeota archaeon]
MQAYIEEVIEAGSVDFSNELYMKIYLSGCDFKCPYCNTPHLLETKFEQEIDLREIKKQMENQKGTVEGIIISGGEPCFQKAALLDMLSKAKELEMKTVIDTNGSKPDVIEALLKNELITKINVDIKAPMNELFDKVTNSSTWFKTSKDIMNDMKQTLEILKAYDEKAEITFQTTIIPGLIFRKEDLMKIAKEIEDINCVWELKSFRTSQVTDKRIKELKTPTDEFLKNIREQIMKEKPGLNMRLSF